MMKLLQDRKTLYLVLGIVMISVFTLSIAYAAMSTVLEIHGNSEVVASSWDIHLENVKVKNGSVSANTPSISGTSSVGFDIELNTPGEYYEFTVDVVNEGSIDAMIDSVVKSPELTTEQAKYIKYEITYANGESISTKQTLKKGTSTPIKVRVEYRKDLVSSDLPSGTTELSLKLTLVYVQSDGSGSSNSGTSLSVVSVVSGDGTNIGDEVCIKDECFYVISSDDTSVTMLAKYNLHVGSIIDEKWNVTPIESPTGIQDSNSLGLRFDFDTGIELFPFIGTPFSSDEQKGINYSDYSGSIVEGYVNNYHSYLTIQGVPPIESRLITYDELISLGCYLTETAAGTCSTAPNWLTSTSYWTMSANHLEDIEESYVGIWIVDSLKCIGCNYYMAEDPGVRPVITISKDYL